MVTTDLVTQAFAKQKGGDLEGAVALAEQALTDHPGDGLALFCRGCLRLAQENAQGAIADWEAGLTDRPELVDRLRLEFQPQLDSAFYQFVFETTMDAHDPIPFSALGRAKHLVGHEDEAIRYLSRAVELGKGAWKDALMVGELLCSRGDHEAALAMLNRVLETRPDLAAVHYQLGQVYKAQNSLAFALRHLERAVALEKTHTDARLALADLLLLQGRFEQAEPHLQAVLKESPGAHAHMGLAEVAKSAYRYDEALEHLKQAVQLEPDNLQAQIDLGTMALQFGDADLGGRSLRRALELDPDRVDVYAQLARAAVLQNDKTQAIFAYRELLRRSPNDAVACHALGKLLREQGEQNEAAEVLARASELLPHDPMVTLDFAATLGDLGRDEQQKEVLRSAFEVHPNNQELQAALAAVDPDAFAPSESRSGEPAAPVEFNPWLDTEEEIILPGEVSGLLAQGRSFAEAGRDGEALALFQTALSQKPHDRECLLETGRCLIRRGLTGPGTDLLVQALAVSGDPDLVPEVLTALSSVDEDEQGESVAALVAGIADESTCAALVPALRAQRDSPYQVIVSHILQGWAERFSSNVELQEAAPPNSVEFAATPIAAAPVSPEATQGDWLEALGVQAPTAVELPPAEASPELDWMSSLEAEDDARPGVPAPDPVPVSTQALDANLPGETILSAVPDEQSGSQIEAPSETHPADEQVVSPAPANVELAQDTSPAASSSPESDADPVRAVEAPADSDQLASSAAMGEESASRPDPALSESLAVQESERPDIPIDVVAEHPQSVEAGELEQLESAPTEPAADIAELPSQDKSPTSIEPHEPSVPNEQHRSPADEKQDAEPSAVAAEAPQAVPGLEIASQPPQLSTSAVDEPASESFQQMPASESGNMKSVEAPAQVDSSEESEDAAEVENLSLPAAAATSADTYGTEETFEPAVPAELSGPESSLAQGSPEPNGSSESADVLASDSSAAAAVEPSPADNPQVPLSSEALTWNEHPAVAVSQSTLASLATLVAPTLEAVSAQELRRSAVSLRALGCWNEAATLFARSLQQEPDHGGEWLFSLVQEWWNWLDQQGNQSGQVQLASAWNAVGYPELLPTLELAVADTEPSFPPLAGISREESSAASSEPTSFVEAEVRAESHPLDEEPPVAPTPDLQPGIEQSGSNDAPTPVAPPQHPESLPALASSEAPVPPAMFPGAVEAETASEQVPVALAATLAAVGSEHAVIGSALPAETSVELPTVTRDEPVQPPAVVVDNAPLPSTLSAAPAVGIGPATEEPSTDTPPTINSVVVEPASPTPTPTPTPTPAPAPAPGSPADGASAAAIGSSGATVETTGHLAAAQPSVVPRPQVRPPTPRPPSLPPRAVPVSPSFSSSLPPAQESGNGSAAVAAPFDAAEVQSAVVGAQPVLATPGESAIPPRPNGTVQAVTSSSAAAPAAEPAARVDSARWMQALEVLRTRPENERLLEAVLRDGRQHEEVLLNFFRSVTRTPDVNPLHFRNFARFYTLMEKPMLAVVQYHKFLGARPTPSGYRELARAYSAMGREKHAIDAERKAGELEATQAT